MSRERQLTFRERRAGRAVDGVEGPPRTADQYELRAAAALLDLVGSVPLLVLVGSSVMDGLQETMRDGKYIY